MKKILIPFTTIMVATVLLSACTNREMGTVGGAAVGGVVGSAVTGGSTGGTILGAVGGGVVGNSLAR
jgi:osmotically inducible lipoprotein OsmB